MYRPERSLVVALLLFTRVVVPEVAVPGGEIGLLEKARCLERARAMSTVVGVVVEGAV